MGHLVDFIWHVWSLMSSYTFLMKCFRGQLRHRCQKLGAKLTYIRVTKEWIKGEIEDYTMSEAPHDIFAPGKIRAWFEGPGSLE